MRTTARQVVTAQRQPTHAYLIALLVVVGCCLLLAPIASAAQPPNVYLNASWSDRPVEPTRFGPNSGPGSVSEATDYVQALAWSSWGGPQATATGRVRLFTDRTSTSPVTVTVGGLQNCGGLSIYSSYALQLAAGATPPKYWPSGQTGSFPCQINAGGYYPGGPRSSLSSVPGGGFTDGLQNSDLPDLSWLERSQLHIRWKPALPRGSAYALFAHLQWSHWGAPTVTGRGTMGNGVRAWGVTLQLDHLAWCSKLGVAYTHLTMTTYGPGITSLLGLTNAESLKVRSTAGRAGLSKRVYTQREPVSAGCQ